MTALKCHFFIMTYVQLLKDFTNKFDDLAMKHSAWNVWEHFLDCAINGFCFNYDSERMEYIRKTYSLHERHIFGEMIYLWINIMNDRIQVDHQWHDFFGTFYENASINKTKGFAQFFTPETICNFMAKVVYSDLPNDEFKTVAEPAVGSGRNCLAYHALHQNAFHAAMDLDIVCTKMSALNFMVHGIKGIVECQDALMYNESTWRCAFITNDKIAPSIIYVDNYKDAQRYIYNKTTTPYQQYLDMKAAMMPKVEPETKKEIVLDGIDQSTRSVQLSLF